MTSLTFDTTEVFILSANSAVTPPTAAVRAPVSPTWTGARATVFFVPVTTALVAAAALAAVATLAAGAAFTGVAATTCGAAFTAVVDAALRDVFAAGAALLATLPAARPGAGAFCAPAARLAAGLLLCLPVALRGASGCAAGAVGADLGGFLPAVPAVFAGRAAAFGVAGAACAGGDNTPAIFFASAVAIFFTTPGAGLLALAADFATVSFILPSRCLPLAAVACWQYSRQTKALPSNAAARGTRCHHKTGIVYTKHCSKPRIKTSFGKFLPIKTILLARVSFSAHLAPRSLPIIWCTPWKTTLRSAPSISRTPL